jgi:hypothetical protein
MAESKNTEKVEQGASSPGEQDAAGKAEARDAPGQPKEAASEGELVETFASLAADGREEPEAGGASDGDESTHAGAAQPASPFHCGACQGPCVDVDHGAILDDLISVLSLAEGDRSSLKTKRGFTTDMIESGEYRSCSDKAKDCMWELRDRWPHEKLVELGLFKKTKAGKLHPCEALQGMQWNEETEESEYKPVPLIPYFDFEGKVFFVRPHKGGFKGHGANPYLPKSTIALMAASDTKTLVIAESEFKAEAAASGFGVPAVGSPGISTFGKDHLPRLVALIKDLGAKRVVICFDDEVKDDPLNKNYKPDTLVQWDTQYWAVRMAKCLWRDLNRGRRGAEVKTAIACMPEDWRVAGKVDIDGALAQGKKPEEFVALIEKALHPQKYLGLLPKAAQAIVRHNLAKKLGKESLEGLIEKDGGYIFVKEAGLDRNGDPTETKVQLTDWTIEMVERRKAEAGMARSVVLIREKNGKKGRSAVTSIAPKDYASQSSFRAWVGNVDGNGLGDFAFNGTAQVHLNALVGRMYETADPRTIYEPFGVGRIEPGLYLFGNCLVRDGRIFVPPTGQDVIWDGLKGYRPETEKQGAPRSHLPELCLDTKVKIDIGEFATKLEKAYATKGVLLMLGWALACPFHKDLGGSFPIANIGGQTHSGKSMLRSLLQAFFGFSPDVLGAGTTPAMTASAASLKRFVHWHHGIMAVLDEYRRDDPRQIKRLDDILRNYYDGTTGGRATKGQKNRYDQANAGLMLVGQDVPEDQACFTRLLPVRLRKYPRDADPRGADAFKWLEEQHVARTLSAILRDYLVDVTSEGSDFLLRVKTAIRGFKERFSKWGVDSRVAHNYAIAAGFHTEAVLRRSKVLDMMTEGPAIVAWLKPELTRTQAQANARDTLDGMWDDMVALGSSALRQLVRQVVIDDKPGIAIWLPQAHSEITKERLAAGRGMLGFSAKELRTQMLERYEILQETKKVRLPDADGIKKPQGCLVIALNSATPSRILDMLPGEKIASPEEVKEEEVEEETMF